MHIKSLREWLEIDEDLSLYSRDIAFFFFLSEHWHVCLNAHLISSYTSAFQQGSTSVMQCSPVGLRLDFYAFCVTYQVV